MSYDGRAAGWASPAMRSTTSLDVEPGGVEHDRVAGRPQRAVLTIGVALVAAAQFVQHRLAIEAELCGAPARPLGGIGGEEDLQRRIGGDHRADVPALGHHIAAGHQLPLQSLPPPRARPGRRRRARPSRRPPTYGSPRSHRGRSAARAPPSRCARPAPAAKASDRAPPAPATPHSDTSRRCRGR